MTIDLPADLIERLRAIAARSGTSLDQCAAQAIERFIEDAEDYAAAMQALAEGGRRWTLEEIKQELDLAP